MSVGEENHPTNDNLADEQAQASHPTEASQADSELQSKDKPKLDIGFDDFMPVGEAQARSSSVNEPSTADNHANAADDSVAPASEGGVSSAALEAAEAKAAENWDKYLRLQAEMENLTRRKDKQIEDAHKFSVQKIVESILPVMDSMEMGMKAEGDVEQIREGMQLTLKQFESVMDKFDIQAIDPTGEKFNPELHQAMAMQPSADHENNDVLMVMQKGYSLSGRLVRPAMVMVCKN